MGAVLTQETADGKRNVISYASAKFSPAETRYHCNEQECLAVIWAIRHYRPYLEDHPFKLRTDSKTLTWLKNQKDTRAKLTRWHLLLSEFSFEIEHVPGKDNELPDALSRFPNPNVSSPGEPDLDRMLPPTPSASHTNDSVSVPVLSSLHASILFDEIINAQQLDPTITREAIGWREIHERGPANHDEEKFLLLNKLDKNGFWRRDISSDVWRIQVPIVCRERVVHEFHDTPLSGHPGADETIRSIREFFFWKGMNREIRRYVAGCHLCICCKPTHGQQPSAQRPRSARSAWDSVAVDFMGPYPRTSRGNTHIMVVTDMFTRWVEAFPMRICDAPHSVKLFEEQVFTRFGYPKRLLSDNGPQFAGRVWATAAKNWDCELWTTPVSHPRANPTERRNQEVKKGLRLRLHENNQRTWDTHLPGLLFGLRRRQNAATGVTPSYLLFGKTIARPGEWRFRDLQAADESTEHREREEEARKHQAAYQAVYAPKPISSPPRFTIGDWVYSKSHFLSDKAKGFNAKLAQSRTGPYPILENVSGEVYWILKDGTPQKVHGDTLVRAPPRTLPAGVDGAPPLPSQVYQLPVEQPNALPERVVDAQSQLPTHSRLESESSDDEQSHSLLHTAFQAYQRNPEAIPAPVRTVRVAHTQTQPPTHSMLEVESGDDDQSRSHPDAAEQARSRHAEADQLPARSTVPEEEDEWGNASRRYNLRARTSVDYRDNRSYAPRTRRT